jgi:ATP-dependent Clp protease ATP-binding subunit ClpA
MFERFTDKARNVLALARKKAAERGDGQIGAVHMLFGLAAADGLAAQALASLGVDAAAVERELGPGGAAAGPRGPAGETAGDAEALAAIGIDLDEIKRKVEESFGPGALDRVPPAPPGPLGRTGRMTLTDQARLSLALSLKEAKSLHHNYIGTEHLLLGLLRVAERNPRSQLATVTLPDLRLDPAGARAQVLDELRQRQG